ncbi:cysteine hydrolase [Budviciaceae bacterium BWR-B9]|uniref:Cysteine hydrolase n=1 Tax=Limnobaculum allomyrinae TaxID=2791986 RepID=A0ABS1IPH3_9GAMM|nr:MULTISPECIES: cysteine hydrolase family protein [Limnobaculum]MBK5143658.1 cysteine hydrolase [Limnobaculum allomyrinae]MBV7692674.1 cysteine hydrolase [Limnobaculum sp. M2-1]
MDRPTRALIVIDVQNEYFTGELPIEYPPVEISLNNIIRAMAVAKKEGIPIVVVQNSAAENSPVFARGSKGWALHPEIQRQHHDLLIEKRLPDAFAETALMAWLKDRQINTLTIVGYMTHNCDASTIYHASHAGFSVEFLSDATGSLPYENQAGKATAEEIHRVFSVVFHSRFAAAASTAEWLKAVENKQGIAGGNILASNHKARGLKS